MEFIEDGFGLFPPCEPEIWWLSANLAFYRIQGGTIANGQSLVENLDAPVARHLQLGCTVGYVNNQRILYRLVNRTRGKSFHRLVKLRGRQRPYIGYMGPQADRRIRQQLLCPRGGVRIGVPEEQLVAEIVYEPAQGIV